MSVVIKTFQQAFIATLLNFDGRSRIGESLVFSLIFEAIGVDAL